jgi:hypothetical protein
MISYADDPNETLEESCHDLDIQEIVENLQAALEQFRTDANLW